MEEKVEKFNGLTDLYKRILPALNTKVYEFKRENIKYIDCIDIWNYCLDNIWKDKKDIRMYEMVDDILNVNYLLIDAYIRKGKNKYNNEE